MYQTRREFLEEVMKRAELSSLEEADRVAQVVIGLIKARIGSELSAKVAEVVPEDLARGWKAIALPSEAMELQEMMFELDESAEQKTTPEKRRVFEYVPEYG